MSEPLGQSNGMNWSASHLLLDNGNTEELLLPIKATERIKYTCVALSKRFIAFGATSGGLYIFQRDTHKYLQVIVNKEGSVTHVKFAPDDNLVGLSTNNGYIVIWQLNVVNRKKPELLMTSFAHKGSNITCLQWNDTSHRLYSGDNKGKVTLTNVYSRKVSGLLQLPTAPIVSLDSAIVQLDFIKDFLLVSSHNKCHICNIKRQQFYSVGKKLRDGLYGACFYLKSKEPEDVVIYSARPGSRLWEANLNGEVVATHQFKRQLAIPDLAIINFQEDERYPETDDHHPPQALNFPRLLKVEQFIMSWNEKAIYFLDTSTGKVVLWSRPPAGIQFLSSYKSEIYYLDNQSRINKLSFLTIERCIVRLFIKKAWKLCASVCHQFSENLTTIKSKRLVSVNFLKDIKENLTKLEKTEDLIGSLDDVIYQVEQFIMEVGHSGSSSRRSSIESAESVRLESGIYLVKSRRSSEESLERMLQSMNEDHSLPASPNLVDNGNVLNDTKEFNHNELSVETKQQLNGGSVVNPSISQVCEDNFQKDLISQQNVELTEENFQKCLSSQEDSEPQSKCGESRVGGVIAAEYQETGISMINVDCLKSTDIQHNDIEFKPTSPELAKSHNTIIAETNIIADVSKQSSDEIVDDSRDLVLSKTPVVIVTAHSVNETGDRNETENVVDLNENEKSDLFAESAYEPVMRRTESFSGSSNHDKRTIIERSKSMSNYESTSPKPSRKLRKKKSKTKSRVAEIGEVKKSKDKVSILEDKKADEPLKPRPINLNLSNKSPSRRSNSPLFEKLFESDETKGSGQRQISIPFAAVKVSLSSTYSKTKEFVKAKLDSNKKSPVTVEDEMMSSSGQVSPVAPIDVTDTGDILVKACETSENYSPFEEATISTRIKLQHPLILYDINMCREVLEQWLLDLQTAYETNQQFKPEVTGVDEENELTENQTQTDTTILDTKIESVEHDNLVQAVEENESVESDDQLPEEDKTSLPKDNEKSKDDEVVKLVTKNKQTEYEHHLQEETDCDETLSNLELITDSSVGSSWNFPLRDSLHDHASQLLMMCFEIQLFPDLKHLNLNQSNEISATNQNPSLTFEAADCSASKPSECSGETLDVKAARFIRQFSHFLDINRIRLVMSSWQGSRQKTYSEICNLFADSFGEKQDRNCKSALCEKREIQQRKHYKDVYRILTLLDSEEKLVERLVDSDLRIWEVKELFEIYQPEKAQRLFAKYIAAELKEDLGNGCNCLDEVIDDNGVAGYLVNSIFNCNTIATKMSICSCKAPRCGSHTVVWQYKQILDKLIVEMATPKMADMCKDRGYWRGCLELSAYLPRETILHIVWCLGDVNILQAKNLSPTSSEEWRYILEHISQLKAFQEREIETSIKCLQCLTEQNATLLPSDTTDSTNHVVKPTNTITWENTVQLLAKTVGPQTAIDLLGQFTFPKNTISPEFFHNCIMGIVIDRNQRLLTHAMLEKVDSYLWSKRQNALPQQLKQFVKEEHRCLLAGSSTKPKEPSFKGTLSGREHFLEEPLSHWGVNVSLNTDCLVCGLQVTMQVSDSSPGLLVFPCGHIFHTECIPEKFCMVCFYSKK
ncbi:uncharacterized protein [Antedon mediterranea]|uniref:uncharacterized protein n=1 Tax=Antedon mediterranea TaxID=105859 RepID=UPI003AF6F112